MTYIKGVDFSHWQSKVDFSKLVANDIEFAIFKAGEIPTGSKIEYADDMYARNMREAKEYGIISGAYYFFHPAIGASRQARHFLNLMDAYGWPDLPPVIDVEAKDARDPITISSVLKAMIDAMMADPRYEERYSWQKPIIYSRWGFLVNEVGNPAWLKDHYLWLAQYNTTLTYKPKDMSNVIMWQYTDRLRLPGIGVNLDGNYWLKSREELHMLAGIEPPAVDNPAPSVLVAEKYKKSLIGGGPRYEEFSRAGDVFRRLVGAWRKVRG